MKKKNNKLKSRPVHDPANLTAGSIRFLATVQKYQYANKKNRKSKSRSVHYSTGLITGSVRFLKTEPKYQYAREGE